MEKVFRCSLFGYSKKSVMTYITGMNEEFSKKLMEKDLECRNTVQKLEEQLEQLRQENEQLQAGRQEVAGALIDAKAFAAELVERAKEEDAAIRAKNEAYHQTEFQRLRALSNDIDALRASLRSAVRDLDDELERYGVRVRDIQSEFYGETPDEEPAAAVTEGEYEVAAQD